jgi:nicotinamidase-related amidase
VPATIRTAYVDSKNLEQRAAEWMRKLAPYQRHPFERDRLGDSPALVVVDMQRFFLDEGAPADLPAGRAVIPNVQRLVRSFREHGLAVIFLRHVSREGDAGGSMHRWWNSLIEPSDPLTALHAGFVPEAGEVLITKNRYSGFHGTELEKLLQDSNASCVVVAGIMTHLCCESTAREAFMRGFDVVAVADGMATKDEELHLSSMKTLAEGFASIGLTADIVEALGDG